MGCTDASALTELEFVHELRGLALDACAGPLVTLPLVAYRLEIVEASLTHEWQHHKLWDAFLVRTDDDRMLFQLCVAHWMALAYIVRYAAVRVNDAHRFNESVTLERQVCQAVGWDVKEIHNMIAWQRVRLT